MKKSVLEQDYNLEKDIELKFQFLSEVEDLSDEIKHADLEQGFLTLFNKKGLAIARYKLTDFKCNLVDINKAYLKIYKENNSNLDFADVIRVNEFYSKKIEEFYIKFKNRIYPNFKKDYLRFVERYAMLQLSDIEEKDLNPQI